MLNKPLIGWREWVKLPDLKIERIKVKMDTGAKTASLHAFDMHYYHRNGKNFVRFKVHPQQKSLKPVVECHAEVLEFRKVKSSNGQVQNRPVIESRVEILGECYSIEITLTNRDEMGFRMLLGRDSVRKRFYVDPTRSFYGLKSSAAINKLTRARKK